MRRKLTHPQLLPMRNWADRCRRAVRLAAVGLAAVGLAAVVLAPVVLTGCVADGARTEPIELVPMRRPYERDIPVPQGFTFVESASEDASTGARRLYLRHTYAGRAPKVVVRGFYREQMPLARWVGRGENNVKGEYTLRFRKAGERCEVRIRDRKNHRGQVEVMVLVMPGGADQAPPVRRKR